VDISWSCKALRKLIKDPVLYNIRNRLFFVGFSHRNADALILSYM
jgi:hypothetical protein